MFLGENINVKVPGASAGTWDDVTKSVYSGNINAVDRAFSLTVRKIDSSDNILPGATLRITGGASDFSTVTVTNAENIVNSSDYLEWKTTSDASVIKGLPAGSYTLTEVEAPTNYAVAEPVSFTVDSNGNVAEYQNNTITMTDTVLTGAMTLVKYDSRTNARVSGAKFVLEQSTDGNTWAVYGTEQATANNGTVSVDGLPCGYYYRFKETGAADGYDAPESAAAYTESVYLTTGNVDGSVSMTNTALTGSVTLTKTEAGSGNAIGDAKFQLYYKANTANDSSYVLYSDAEYTTAANGTVTADNLPWGYTYKFREISAPEKYVEYTGYSTEAVLTAANRTGSVSLTNTLKETQISLTAAKVLDGRTLAADDSSFTFVLSGNGIETRTVKNNGYSIDFGSITYNYNDIGNHVYIVTEQEYNANGITSDDSVYSVTVTVSAANGVLSAEVTSITKDGEAADSIVFTNTYTTTDASATISGTKTLNGRDMAEGEFTFDLYKDGEIIDTVTNEANGSFSFPARTYTTTGEYIYTVKERAGAAGGVEYDKAVYTVTVTVTDNGTGSLVAEVTSVKKDGEPATGGIVFTNTYTAAKASTDITGTKTISGAVPAEGAFTFELWKADENCVITSTKVDEAENDANGRFTLYTEDLTSEGIYNYIIKEKIPADTNGVSYDTREYLWSVNVQDNGKGALAAADSLKLNGEAVNAVVFANTYSEHGAVFSKRTAAGSRGELAGAELTLEALDMNADLSGVVLPDGVELSDDGRVISWTSGDSDIQLGGLPLGEYRFTEVTEPDGYEKAETIYVKITDTGVYSVSESNYNGSSTEWGSKVDDDTVVMYDEPLTGSVTLIKTESGSGKPIGGAKFQLYYKANGAEDSEYALYSDAEYITAADDGTVTADNLPWGYTYKFRETVTPEKYVEFTGYSDEAVLTSVNRTGSVSLTNTLKETQISITAAKALDGKALSADDSSFTFELAGDGFETRTVHNNGAEISFGSITYNYDDIGEHVYTVTEQEYNANGITGDDSVYSVTVTVSAENGVLSAEVTSVTKDGVAADSIVFTNTYRAEPTAVTVNGVKTLTGRAMAEGEFTFELWAVSEQAEVLAATAANAADGSFILTSGCISDSDIYSFVIRERIPENAVNYKYHGVTYDTAEYRIDIPVYDDGEGHMTYDAAALETLTFENTYNTDVCTANISGTKVLSGSVLAADQFRFQLWAADENGVISGTAAKTQVTNAANGSFVILSETFSQPGTYYYVIKEEFPANTGSTVYDRSEYLWKITVTDDGFGSLVPESELRLSGVVVDELKFTNVVTARDVAISKRIAGGGDELPGAMLKITPTDTSVDLSKVVLPEGVDIADGSIEWISDDTPVIIGDLPYGIYKLTEITAPDGYKVAESIYFRVTADGVYSVNESAYKAGNTVWGNAVANNTVIMIDAPQDKPTEKNGEFSFVKYNNLGQTVSGAKFTLTNDKKQSVSCTTAANGVVSFKDIAPGSYILTEASAPSTLNRSEENVRVTVNTDGSVWFANAGGTALNTAGVEKLMTNTIKPVKSEKNIKVEDSVDLKADLLANREDLKNLEFTWESSDSSVATVDSNGKVTFKRGGKVTITVKSGDVVLGSYVLGASDDSNGTGGNNNSNNIVPNTGDTDAPKTSDRIYQLSGIIISVLVVTGVTVKLLYRDVVKRRRNGSSAE